MIIKYAGPRPEISQHGIQFKEGKEDKYVYLMISLQILKSIDHNHNNNQTYNYDISTQRLSDSEMTSIMKKYDPKIEEHIKSEIDGYEKHLDQEIEHINSRVNLANIEKEAWVNNLKLMKEYRMQRGINKIYYMHSIDYIKKVILREKIKQIDTPFYEKFWHVLQTIQGHTEEGKIGMISKLDVFKNKDGQLMASLTIPGFQ
jgi:hypothetical protein